VGSEFYCPGEMLCKESLFAAGLLVVKSVNGVWSAALSEGGIGHAVKRIAAAFGLQQKDIVPEKMDCVGFYIFDRPLLKSFF